jgi:hypothetical protein
MPLAQLALQRVGLIGSAPNLDDKIFGFADGDCGFSVRRAAND